MLPLWVPVKWLQSYLTLQAGARLGSQPTVSVRGNSSIETQWNTAPTVPKTLPIGEYKDTGSLLLDLKRCLRNLRSKAGPLKTKNLHQRLGPGKVSCQDDAELQTDTREAPLINLDSSLSPDLTNIYVNPPNGSKLNSEISGTVKATFSLAK